MKGEIHETDDQTTWSLYTIVYMTLQEGWCTWYFCLRYLFWVVSRYRYLLDMCSFYCDTTQTRFNFIVINQSQLPPPESLNGPSANMSLNINYRCQKGSHETDYSAAVSNTTAWSVNIPAWQHYERCSVWLRTCNGLFCSAISNPCVVGGFQGTAHNHL